jgi:hypothetical protein
MGAPTIISLDKKFMRKRPLAVSAEASCRKEEPYDEELLVGLSHAPKLATSHASEKAGESTPAQKSAQYGKHIRLGHDIKQISFERDRRQD